MLRSAVTTFYRSLIRHPLYAALNLLGLSFGVAVFIVLVLFVRFETSYEQWLPDAGAIYEVATTRTDNGQVRRKFASSGGTFDAVHHEFPDVLGSRVAAAYIVVRKGNEVFEEEGQLVDRDAFRLFRVKWLAGDARTALRPGGIVLSEAMARKYFGRSDVLNRTISLRDDVGPSIGAPGAPPPPARDFVVTGVIGNPPANSALRFDFVRLMTDEFRSTEPWWNDWGVPRHHTYLYLPKAADVRRVAAGLDRVVDVYGSAVQHDSQPAPGPRHDHIRLVLTPLAGEHLSDGKARATVWLLGVVGLLALGVALINYINLATARAGLRAREVAVRKAMGASVAQIRLQFLAEALLVSLAAGLLGFSLVELLLPPVNAFGGLSLRLDYVREAPLLLALLAAVGLSGLLAGMYPAVVLSGFEPAHVLSSSRSPAGGKLGLLVREGLAVVQFTVVTVFFIVVAGFSAQTRHIETSDLGFERHGVLMTYSTISAFLDIDHVEAIRAQWRALPNVVSVSSGSVPGPYFMYGLSPVALRDTPGRVIQAKDLYIERDFFRTYGTRVIAGRTLGDGDRVSSMRGQAEGGPAWINVALNRTAARALGFADPSQAVGKALVTPSVSLRVVGVVADQRFAAPTEDVGPCLYIIGLNTASDSSTLIRFAGVPEEVMRARMAAVWRTAAPDLPLSIESVGQVLESYYAGDRQNTGLFAVGAAVAGFVGGIGLYGMAAFSTSNRAREIGLRKAMGASRRRIAALLVMQFLRPVLVANLIAWPVAWLFLSQWLGQFDDRVPLSLWFFSVGSAVSLLIAVATVTGLTLAAAWAAPGKVLRNE